VIEVVQRRPAFDIGAAPLRIDLNLPHIRQIDHQPIVAQSVAGDIVASAAYGQAQAMVAREGHLGVHPAPRRRPIPEQQGAPQKRERAGHVILLGQKR